MAWFNKGEEGQTPVANSNQSGRVPYHPSMILPETRDPRLPLRPPVQKPVDAKFAGQPAKAGASTQIAARASVLGSSLRFKGDLFAQEDLIVQGKVEGSINHTQILAIGPDGSMKGDIRARVIIVDGEVAGDLYAIEFINIRATAKVRGNVFAPRISIGEGAFFQGQISMQRLTDEQFGVHPDLVESDAPVEMESGGAAGLSNGTDA